MHRSRLGGLIIDCKTDDLDTAARFWSQALGLEILPTTNPEDAGYISFKTPPNDLDVEVQQVAHDSRVHIDIETDDIDREVSRLETLGARKVEQIRDWVVMEAPTGHRFCLVPVQRSAFAEEANVWE